MSETLSQKLARIRLEKASRLQCWLREQADDVGNKENSLSTSGVVTHQTSAASSILSASSSLNNSTGEGESNGSLQTTNTSGIGMSSAASSPRYSSDRISSPRSKSAHALQVVVLAEADPTCDRQPALPPKAHAIVRTRVRSASTSDVRESTGDDEILVVNGKSYRKLEKLGTGGSSTVYLVQNVTSETRELVAIKEVSCGENDGNDAIKDAFTNEVKLLNTLGDCSHIIKMIDYEIMPDRLYLVLERGDVDLEAVVRKRSRTADDAFLRFYWKEMLHCVKDIHDNNIVHTDLKPANFLFVKGALKLIDFGIASKIPKGRTSVVKQYPWGTLTYMPPEIARIEQFGRRPGKVPLKADVWSLGCILYALAYRRHVFLNRESDCATRMKAICDESVEIEFPEGQDPLLVDTLKRCLQRDISKRASVDELLKHPYCSGPSLHNGSSTSPHRLEESISAIAEDLLKYTPRTTLRKLNDLASKRGHSTSAPASKLDLDI